MAKERDRRKGGKGGKRESERDRRRTPKKKISVLNTDSIKWIDYKDVNLLRRFMSERAKIRARRVTGNSAQQQRAVARAIRVAREMALLPYAVRQVTQRSKGGRGRDRGDRDMLREPTPEMAPPAEPDAPPPTPDAELAGVEASDVEAPAEVDASAPDTGRAAVDESVDADEVSE
jgi:small subunit ribosomal protein S18